MRDLDLKADVIDVRDVIARVEELREERDALREAAADEDGADTVDAAAALREWEQGEDAAELAELEAILADLANYGGGGEQWDGDWYPVTLIADWHFKEYAQDLADEIGAVNADAGWPNNCIDWDKAARELRMDYTSCDVAGNDYWFR